MTLLHSAALEGLLAEQGLDRQIALLRAEEQACDDAMQRAALLCEIGTLIEERQGNESLAIRDYLAAFNLAPQFRPSLYALIRIFERRRSFKNLVKLYEAEANAAGTAREKASALVDSGTLLEDHLEQIDLGRSMLEEAALLDPSLQVTWLMLERSARRAGDHEAAERGVAMLADHVEDPQWKAVLNAESAIALSERGRIDEAIKLLRSCIKQGSEAWLYLQQLEYIARKHRRHHVLIDALEQRALLLNTPHENAGVPLQPQSPTAQRYAAALWAEVARLRIHHDNDAQLALQSYQRAIAAAPDNIALLMDMCVHIAKTPYTQDALACIHALIEKVPPPSLLGTLHILEAEILQSNGQSDHARGAFQKAIAACPQSSIAHLLFYDHVRRAYPPDARIEILLEWSARNPSQALNLRWEAAQIAADELNDASKARTLYQSAALGTDQPTTILRELYGNLLKLGDLYAAREIGSTLLAGYLENSERSALLRDQYELLRDVFGDLDATQELLKEALHVPAALAWAPDAARIFAAMNDHASLCGEAHDTLGEQCSDARLAAAHFCAAARSHVRAKSYAAASLSLERVLSLVPHHAYAASLLQYLVQSGERSSELIALYRQASLHSSEPSGLESSLLATAFEAEVNQDFATAIQTYQQLYQLNPNAVAASWHLRRLALRLGRKDLLEQALQGLASREEATRRPGFAVLELAALKDLVKADPTSSQSTLYSLLHHPDMGAAAALMLLTQPLTASNIDYTQAALQRLSRGEPSPAYWALQRDYVALAFQPSTEKNVGTPGTIIDDLLHTNPKDFMGHWSKLRLLTNPSGDADQRSELLMKAAKTTADQHASSDLMLHAIRTKMLSDANDAQGDAVIYAHDIAPQADPLITATAFDETLSGGDDPEMRTKAFEIWMQHVGPTWSMNARAALGRTLATAGRYEDATRVLSEVLTQDNEDLASWEALRFVARQTGKWEMAARACDMLSNHGSASLKASLLEESALIWLNEVRNEAEAEPRLKHALELDPSLRLAYDHYYRLLRKRNDTLGLLDLLRGRLGVVSDTKERCRLYYEQAILFRSIGNLDECNQSVKHILASDPKHVGALALLAETSTMLEQWDTAVTVLRQLADAEVPVSQRRLSRLTVANILERKKNDPKAALTELALLEQSNGIDDELLMRSAQIAERIGDYPYAITKWEQLSHRTSGIDRAAYQKRIARIYAHNLHNQAKAMQAYQAALQSNPADTEACEELINHTLNPQVVHQLIFDVRQHLYRMLDPNPLEPTALRKLLRAAVWAKDLDRQQAILDVLVILGLASDEEHNQWSELRPQSSHVLEGMFDNDMVQHITALPASGPADSVLKILAQTLGNKPSHELKRLGVERSHRIKNKTPCNQRDELLMLCSAFQVNVSEVYLGGHTREGIAALGDSKSCTWVIGTEITSPLTPISRFAVGQLLYGLKTGLVPLMRRQSNQVAAIMFDVAEAMQFMFPQSVSYFDQEHLAPGIMQNLTSKARRTLDALWPQIELSGQPIVDRCHALERSAMRTGLLLANDLDAVLRFVVGPLLDSAHIVASELATDLVRFWISDEASLLRKQLGIAR